MMTFCNVIDMHALTHPGDSTAPVGPYVVVCPCGYQTAPIDDFVTAERKQRAHNAQHYEAGETS